MAEMLTRVVGRNILHVRLTESELAAKLQKRGMPADEAAMHASLDLIVEAGAEERLNTEVKDLTGEEARSFADFVSDNKNVWLLRD